MKPFWRDEKHGLETEIAQGRLFEPGEAAQAKQTFFEVSG